jgi:5'-methylthioadenosine phosphorylase
MVLQNLMKNVNHAKKILELAIPEISVDRTCKCKDALKYAIATSKNVIPAKTKKKLKLIIGKYIT